MQVTNPSETQSQTEQSEQPTSEAATTRSARKTILAWSVFALGLNACAAVYTLSPSDFTLPNVYALAELVPDVSRLAELLPQQKASDPVQDPVVTALKDIQAAQQQHLASLQENSSSLQQNTALLQQDSNVLGSLRQSITDERVDVKKISAQITDEHLDVKKMSAQISTLIAKVDLLQSAIAPEVTSSIPRGRARNRLTVVTRKKMASDLKVAAPNTKPAGPVSIGGAPLSVGGVPLTAGGVPASFPAFTFAPAPQS
jgi:cell division protein FtsB